MSNTDPRVDAYIERAAAFAKPILARLRAAVHRGCPDASETIKWGMPFFMHEGRLLANMAAFKQHCAFGFWKAGDAVASDQRDQAMGQFGRITRLADLPPTPELMRLVKQVVALIDAAPSAPRVAKGRVTKAPPALPPELGAAFASDLAPRDTFAALSATHRREYIEWIGDAKRAETRTRRVAQTLALLAEGKTLRWKYSKR